jgi:4-diphosphocytidyl-2-C-methyl-D-erythritol kinase
MEVVAHAKINWDLRVLGKRRDGFHQLDTVMVPITLADLLTVAAADSWSLTSSDPSLPINGQNLVSKAAWTFASLAGVKAQARVVLGKAIPCAAGLGGGSSDAAAALIGLNRLWKLDWPRSRLAEVARQVGSDVPFFLYGGWCSCRGRGEDVTPLPGATAWPPVKLLLVAPPFEVRTASVYQATGAPPWNGEAGRSAAQAAEEVRDQLSALAAGEAAPGWPDNQLQDAAIRIEPRLADLREALEKSAPGRWQMSGSGSAHFVVLSAKTSAAEIEERLRALPFPLRVIETTTLSKQEE